MLPRSRDVMRAYAVLWALGCGLLSSRARADAATASSTALAAETPEGFAAFLQKQLKEKLATRKIGGAVLIAVRDGKEFYRMALGHADVERGIAMDPEHSMLHLASVSKTFTGTAVAQLVEAGKLRYTDAANAHLTSFKVHEEFSPSITIADLVTHRIGIPDLFLGAACSGGQSCIALTTFLAQRQPRQRIAPGRFISYSNLSNALAAQVVVDVSGQSFGDYVRQHILKPLHMTSTRYDVPGEPGADDPAAVPAIDYELDPKSGALVKAAAYYSLYYPTGQLQASAADMARYMLAHLEPNSPILSDAARLDMQKLHATNPGFDNGFGWTWNYRRAGRFVVISHSGDLRGVISDLMLIPEARFGYFAAVTGDSDNALKAFDRAFERQYLVEDRAAPVAPPANSMPVPDELLGVYQDFRFRNFDPLRMLSVVSESTITRTAPDEILIALPGVSGGGTLRLKMAGPDELLEVGRDASAGDLGKLRLVRDDKGVLRYITMSNNGYHLTAEKLAFYERTSFKLPALIGAMALTLLLTLASLWSCRRARIRLALPRSRTQLAALSVLALSMLSACAFPVWVVMKMAAGTQWDLLYGLHAMGLRLAYVLPELAVAGFVLSIGAAVVAWRNGWWSRPARVFYSLAVGSGLFYALILGLNGQIWVSAF